MNFALVTGASLLTVIVVHGATFFIARRAGRYNVVDIAWGIGFVAIAAVAAAVGTGDLFRRLLVFALTTVWGLRLVTFVYVKTRGKGEDPRYRDLLRGDVSARPVIRKIFLVQAAATWFVALPLQLSATLGPTLPVLTPVTIAGWISLATVSCPALMTYFLVRVTGARLTEKYMKNRPGFRDYCSRASFFVPRPPRRR